MAVSRVSDLKPVHLIHGREELLLERALRRLRKLAGAEASGEGLDFDTFDGDGGSAADIIAAANTLPFLSERRMVIVRNADKLPADGQALIVEYAKSPAESSVLVLVAPSLAKTTRLYKSLDALGYVSEYAAPTRDKLPGWVVSLFESKGRRITHDAAETLLRAVGKDLRRLESEADKIIAYAGERADVTREDVTAVVIETAPSVYEMLDALGSRNCAVALGLLGDLLAAGEPLLGVHAMAMRHVRSLLGLRALYERGVRGDAAAAALGMAPWQARSLARQADRFRDDELIDALRAGAEAEAKMKTSQGDPRLVFERWLLSTCGGRERR